MRNFLKFSANFPGPFWNENLALIVCHFRSQKSVDFASKFDFQILLNFSSENLVFCGQIWFSKMWKFQWKIQFLETFHEKWYFFWKNVIFHETFSNYLVKCYFFKFSFQKASIWNIFPMLLGALGIPHGVCGTTTSPPKMANYKK